MDLPNAFRGADRQKGPCDLPHSLVGTVVDKYRVLELIGSGGMGIVFRVQQVELGREFALKTLRLEWSGDAVARSRFRGEVRALASIRSEYVVPIVDAGTFADGAPYFVMELLHGRTLCDILADEEHLAAPRVIQIGIQVCLGLAKIHAAGLVHRDLKPENLVIAPTEDGSEKTSILDLGVVRKENSEAVQTTPGTLVGTMRYMAPEQLSSDAKTGPAVDIFALGTILYECVAGLSPFEDSTLERSIFKIVNADFYPLSEAEHSVPNDLVVAIHRAMSRRPEDRYEDASVFAGALARCRHSRAYVSDRLCATQPTFTTGSGANGLPTRVLVGRANLVRLFKVAWPLFVVSAVLVAFSRLGASTPGSARVSGLLHEGKEAQKRAEHTGASGTLPQQSHVEALPTIGSSPSEWPSTTIVPIAPRHSAKEVKPFMRNTSRQVPLYQSESVVESRH